MSSHEFMQRLVHWQLEPWGPLADAWRAGIVSATVVNCTPRRRGSQAARPTDFYRDPYVGEGGSSDLTPEQRAFLKRRKKERGTGRHRND